MRFNELTNENYLMYALLHYDNPHCKDIQEFFEDIKKLHYIRIYFHLQVFHIHQIYLRVLLL